MCLHMPPDLCLPPRCHFFLVILGLLFVISGSHFSLFRGHCFVILGQLFPSYWERLFVMSGPLFRHFGVTFSSFWGHVGMFFGTLWGRFRIVLGRFGEKNPPRSKNQDFQTCPGVFFQRRGAQNNRF